MEPRASVNRNHVASEPNGDHGTDSASSLASFTWVLIRDDPGIFMTHKLWVTSNATRVKQVGVRSVQFGPDSSVASIAATFNSYLLCDPSIIYYFSATVVKLKYYLDSIIPHWQVNYHTSTTSVPTNILGRLSVELLKGSHFRNLTTQKAPDTFVTLTLLDGNCKVKWFHPDPTPNSL